MSCLRKSVETEALLVFVCMIVDVRYLLHSHAVWLCSKSRELYDLEILHLLLE